MALCDPRHREAAFGHHDRARMLAHNASGNLQGFLDRIDGGREEHGFGKFSVETRDQNEFGLLLRTRDGVGFVGADLEIFLQGAAGNKIYNANRASLEAMSVAQNQMTTVLDRWRGEGTSNSMPRAVFGDPNKNGRVSNRFIEDGKYLRLKNVTLGYTLPAAWSKKAAMSSVRFFVSGQNLLTLTRYTGLDPEISGSGNDNNVYPIARNITFGASVSF